MQIDRLFETVHILLNGKCSTTKELAAHFGVSKRTVLRDINTLTMAGVPICTAQGKGGGVSILDGYVLDKTYLTDEERAQILIGLKTLLPTGHRSDALRKLDSLFSGADTDWIEVDFSRWGHTADDRKKFDTLKCAIVQKSAVRFEYHSAAGEASRRTVYPLKLLYKNMAWYLQAYCTSKSDYRVFKLNRILNIEILSDTFDAKDYKAPDFEAESGHDTVKVKAVFSNAVSYRMYDEFSPEEVTKDTDGNFVVETEMPFDNGVVGYFLSFGDKVKILEPQSLKDRITQTAEQIQKVYS